MEKDSFYKLAQNPLRLNSDTLEGLRKLTEDFPYFHAAWLLYLKNLKELNDPEFDAALKKAAPLLPDRKQLYRFLHTVVKPTEFSMDMDKAGIRISEYTLEQTDVPATGESLIDKFLSAPPVSLKLDKPAPESNSKVPENDDSGKSLIESDELITETLANIYANQKKYDLAMEAFKKLSLKYPEKNSYFATRIEEIEKLKNI
jgi:tetratricopeptide (TPR) repeat protein